MTVLLRRGSLMLIVGALAAAASVTLAAAAQPSTTGAAGPRASAAARPDLRITGGRVTLVNGQLNGTFRIIDSGSVSAAPSTAYLSVVVGGAPKLLAKFAIPTMRPAAHRDVRVSFPLPASLPAGSRTLTVCADATHRVTESSEKNNCGRVGSFTKAPVPVAAPVSSVPTDPIQYPKASVFKGYDGKSDYWIVVPDSYDATNQTPSKLFIWLHGCGDHAASDINVISPGGSQDWISLALGGEEGKCWDLNNDEALVLAALADVKTHFNIDPRRVVLGGYSSGCWLAYRTGFTYALDFAGLTTMNCYPFTGTGETESQLLSAAAWKINIVHLAHLQDEEFSIAQTRSETNELPTYGFPFQRIEVDGTHHDEPGAIVNGHPVPGSFADVRTYLLPKIDAGWQAPAS